VLYNQKRPTVDVQEYDEMDEQLPEYLEEMTPGYVSNIGYEWSDPHGTCGQSWSSHVMIRGSGEVVCPHAKVGRFSNGETRCVSDEELAREWTPAT
jgi:hypothetical protein